VIGVIGNRVFCQRGLGRNLPEDVIGPRAPPARRNFRPPILGSIVFSVTYRCPDGAMESRGAPDESDETAGTQSRPSPGRQETCLYCKGIRGEGVCRFFCCAGVMVETVMRYYARLIKCLPVVLLAALSAMLLCADVLADARCSGHKMSNPRPEASCRDVMPQIFVSPDKALRAIVFPADISLDATPDMESRVVIRSSAGDTVTSKDYSSPRGMNGYYVYRAKW
jgi:hypothetical protein